jgi:microcystin-dependent protein
MKTRIIIIMLVLTALVVLLGEEARTNMGQTAFAGEGGAADLSAMPPGSIVVYAGSTPPDGWLLCDGALYDITAAPELFMVIEFTYGSDALQKAFRVPDLQTRVPVGMKPFTYYCDALGKTGGEAEVTLSESEMPSHKHNVAGSGSHTHAITTSPHTHMIAESAHNHVATASPHGHAINDPGHIHSINDPGHHHNYKERFGNDDAAWADYADWAGGGLTTYTRTTFDSQTGILLIAA